MSRHYDIEAADRINAEAKVQSDTPYAMARKRYCKHGHDLYQPENYRFTLDGRRICLKCRDNK